AMRPGRHWEELTTEPKRHGVRQPGASSAYFRGKALDFVVEEPVSALVLAARKLYLFCHGAEIPRDTDVYAARRDSLVVGVLIWPRPVHFPDGVLIPAALLGIAALWRERRRLAAPLAMLAVLAVVTAAFFVTSRHRVPALPLFALFAAAGAPLAWRRWRWFAGGAAAVLIVVLNIPTWETQVSYEGELDFYRGLAATEVHDMRQARAALRRATEVNPDDARAWFELGNILDGRDAADAWVRAAKADPWDLRPSRRAAQAFARHGDLDAAIAVLQASIDVRARPDAEYAPDHLNLAFMRAERGQVAAAIEHVHAAVRADRNYVRATLPRMAEAVRQNAAADPAFLRALEELKP
ncbi:MAG TPA: hypothetical protein VIV11_38360, partial [Kofleriaceae bacterium]